MSALQYHDAAGRAAYLAGFHAAGIDLRVERRRPPDRNTAYSEVMLVQRIAGDTMPFTTCTSPRTAAAMALGLSPPYPITIPAQSGRAAEPSAS